MIRRAIMSARSRSRPRGGPFRNLREYALALLEEGWGDEEVAVELQRVGRLIEDRQAEAWRRQEAERRRQMEAEMLADGREARLARVAAMIGADRDGGIDGSLPSFDMDPQATWARRRPSEIFAEGDQVLSGEPPL